MEEQSIFLQALEKPAGEQREAWLNEVCGASSPLRERIDALLRRHEQADSFLETPPVELGPTLVGNNLAASLQAGFAPAFGENEAVVLGRAGHSVLEALGRTIELPRVALREEAAEGPEPIVRPTSGEMPGKNSDSRYQLQGEIARGGMGAILKGRDVDLGRDLAIKVLLDEHKDKPQVIQRFVEEAQIGGQLQHPGIAPVYELGTFADRRPFFSMKLVKGETLSKLLAEREDPTEDRGRFLGIFEQVCQTMAYAHSRGVIHRDLKPANIMVGAFGEVQVMDWGLAKVLPAGGVADEKKSHQKQTGQSIIQTLRSGVGSDAPGTFGTLGSQTQMGSVMGTPAYMPPEQALGEIDNLDERADVFGLGAILCEILTGMPPYVADDGTRVFRMASRGKLEDCFERLDACGADAELIALAKHCLELEPADRPRDAGALAQRVTDYLESVETKLRETELERAAQAARADAEAAQANAERQRAEAESQRAESESARASEERKRRRMSLALAAAVLLLVSVGSGGWLYLLRQEANRQIAETGVQRRHAREMQILAEQREEQRKVAEQAKTTAEQAEQKAITQKNRADLAAEITQQNLYYAQMHLAQQAWRDHRGTGHMYDLLANWLADDEQPPRRQWEWFYINSLPYQNLRILPKQEIDSGRCSVAWHVSSNRLAEGTANGTIRIWDVEREQITLMIQGPQQVLPYWGRTWFAWNADGDQLAACGRDGTVHVWETVSGTRRLSVKTHNSPGVSVNFDSTGRQVAVCGDDGSIKIVDTQTGEIRPGVTHPSGVAAVAWSFDHRQVAMGHFDGTVTASEMQTGAEITSIPAHSRGIYCLAWSPDGRRLATASAEQFCALIWDLDSRQPVVDPLWHSHSILSMAWSADGHKLATGSNDQTVKIWKTDNGQEVATLRGHFHSAYSLVWGPEDGQLASGGGDGSVKIWTSLQDQESLILPGTIRTTAVAWSPDGKRLAAGSDDGLIRIWEPARSDTLVSLKPSDRREQIYQQFGLIRMLAWSPDGTYLASAGTDGRVDVWNVASGENVVLPPAESGRAWCVAWSPNGKDLAAGFENGTVHIYEGVKQSPSSRVFRAHEKWVFTLAWSPLGDRLASGSYVDDVLRVWDPDQGTEIMVMDNRGSVMGLAWSPDGKQLASSSASRHVKTWDAVTGQQLQTMQGHHDYVNAVVWSPDGSRLASAGFDNSVRIWDPGTGAEACVLRGKNGFFHDVSWNSDGARLAAAGSDGNVWIWDATRGFERDTTLRALPYIDRAVSAGSARGDDLRWYLESYVRAGKLNEALDAATHDTAALVHLSKVAREKELVEFSDKVAARALPRLEQQLAAEPHNVAIATELAYLLLERSRSDWTVLEPVAMKSTGGATLTRQPDGSILASGANTSGDLYTVSAVSTLDRIASVRLEALPDASLPNTGPGRHSSGNFQLSEIRIFNRTGDHATDLSPLPFESASASFDFKAGDADIRGTIDQGLNKVWHVWGRMGKPHEAVFLLKNMSNVVKDLPIVVELRHREYREGINLGRFRLSVSADPTAFEREQKRFAAMNLTDPWVKLAAAYEVVGDQPTLTRLLKQHPEAAVGVADIMAAAKNWAQAIAYYNQVITPETTDPAVLAKRAAVHLATEQWDLAKADWLRAVSLKPELTQVAFNQFRQSQRWNEALEFGQELLDSKPDDSLLWLQLAPVAVLTGDDETYRDFCRRCATQFKGTTDLRVAERVIKGCLIKPGFIDLEMLPGETLAQRLDENTEPEWLRPWAWHSRALLAYRSGDAESTVKHVANSEALKPAPQAQLLNFAVLALAEHQLGHTEKSRLAFKELSQRFAQERTAFQNPDHDLLIAEILLHEADAKINGKPKPKPLGSSPESASSTDRTPSAAKPDVAPKTN